VNIFRRLPLNRLLLLWAVVIAAGVCVTAIASALDSGPVPPAKPLAQAVHDALSGTGGESVQGVSARIQLTNHLLEGANLVTNGGQGGEIASNPLLAGASGRLWLSKDGHARLELQTEQGDTEILYDGHTVSLYDAATNTLYRYTPPASEQSSSATTQPHAVPSVAKIEEAISHLQKHANVSGASPTDIAGHAAYTVRVSPNEAGSLLGGAELSFDAANGMPLRAAIYSTDSSAPVIELAATEVSYGPVPASVFLITPPANAKVEEVKPSNSTDAPAHPHSDADKPKLTTHGHGISSIAVLASSRYGESKTTSGAGKSAGSIEGLPQVNIDGTNASELRTELGTILTFERSGVRYLLAGSVAPSAIEELARGL
jgi:outer membrane lipoprotein-sorting protein